MLWTRDSKNKLFFVERPERLLLFERPEIYHPQYNSISTLEDELSQNALVEVSVSGTLILATCRRSLSTDGNSYLVSNRTHLK